MPIDISASGPHPKGMGITRAHDKDRDKNRDKNRDRNRSKRVACVLLTFLLSAALTCRVQAFGPPCASNGGFYPNAQTFDAHLAQLGILPTASWNFTPHDLPPASAVVLNDPLNINTHASNGNDPWTSGPTNSWPAGLNNVQFSSNTTPNGALTPRGVGGLTFANPGGNNTLSATVAADSLNIVCESPNGRSCNAISLVLAGPVNARVRFIYGDGRHPSQLYQIETQMTAPQGQQSILRFIKSRIVRIDIWNSAGSENVTSMTMYRRPATIDVAGNDGAVNIDDLVAVITSWGPCIDCRADVAPPGGNNQVNIDDLVAIITTWGPLPTAIGECLGGNPSIGHCHDSDDCIPGYCDHTGCTPSACICASLEGGKQGQWICTDECCGHCIGK